MSIKKKRHFFRNSLLIFGIVGIIGYAGYLVYEKVQSPETISLDAYKQEKVRRGSVSTGIREDGTISFGTIEQIFEVAEITDTSDTDSSSANQSTAMGTSSANGMSGMGSTPESSRTTGSPSSASSPSASSGSSSTVSDTALEIEEVYVAPGQLVQEGDKILKLTDESMNTYREELESAVASAELLVKKEEINLETKRAEAEYTYQMYLAEGEIAEETYQATLTSLQEKVTDLEEQIAEEEDEDELEELEADLKIAQNNLTTGSLEAKQTYEKAMTNYQYADQLYEIDTNGLGDDLESARETLEECQKNLEAFESQTGDGIVYALYSGTVSEIAYAAGDTIADQDVLLTYTDAEDITMTVSVSQNDIAGVAVGDAALVYLTAYSDESFDATVTGISAVTAMASATVNYNVDVKLTGNTGKIYSGMTGEVMIAGKSVDDALYISNRAVRMEGTKSLVKVLGDDGAITETEIKTGFSNGKIVAVEEGLEEGQTVLIESQVTQ